MKKYAYIITENRALNIDKVFTYEIGKEHQAALKIGMRVVVPFGRGNRLMKGLVIDIRDYYEGSYSLKKIDSIIDDQAIVDQNLIDLSIWMSENYIASYLDSIRTVLPPGDFKKLWTELEIVDESYRPLGPKEEALFKNLQRGVNSYEDLKKEISGLSSLVKKLIKHKVLRKSLRIDTSVKKQYEKYIGLRDRDQALEKVGKRAKKQREIVDYLLLKNEEISQREILQAVDTSSSTIRALRDKDIVYEIEKEIYRDPVKKDIEKYEKHILNREQKKVYDSILASRDIDFLIRGVTGSGKTEIYLQLVEAMLEEGRDSIILVPEISLTPQTIDRFVGRFGNQVAVLHSRLSFGERFDEWRKINEGEVKIVVGARSAIFAPFKNLGLIVVDEEHETSYKSSMNPKYDALEVARKRAIMEDAKLVRGSATPRIESYYRALNGDIVLLELDRRVNERNLPELEIVDMREELNKGNMTMFSQDLYGALKENLARGKQSILFLNRRGFSTFVSCRQCGYVVKCKECEVSLTYHKGKNLCKCHYCGYTEKVPKLCPQCKSKYIKYFGVGTEQVEHFAREIFPEARIERMDFDTVREKGSYERILGKMKAGQVDILIGTQMIAKGLDFENLTLVGIITADTSLNLPDFRASELSFSLITQVAGRAGRGQTEGRVIVQTYTPDHYSIVHAKNHDYKGFYKEEIALRQAFQYPPFVDMISIVIYGENYSHLLEVSNNLALSLKQEFRWRDVELIGPYPAPLDKIKKNFRYQILIKYREVDSLVKESVDRVCNLNIYGIDFKDLKVNIDVDPISIL